MAELRGCKSEFEEFQREYCLRHRQAEENRQKENRAAVRIQSWFRAWKVRAYISYLHKKAIIIQTLWRGFTARARVRQMVKAAYFIMKMNFYGEMAVRIQRNWRGFYVRKYIHNYYARKEYLEGLAAKSDFLRKKLDEIEELQMRERNCVEMIKKQTAKVYKAHRLHHLLSTKQRPGVLNSPFRAAPHEMELLLRQVKYQVPAKPASRGRNSLVSCLNPICTSFPGTPEFPWMKTTRSCCSRPILPPIVSKEQQGLYRKPGELWEQRVHCPELMLRLQTSYRHLEEAQSQLRQHESQILPSVTRETRGMSHHLKQNSSSLTKKSFISSSF